MQTKDLIKVALKKRREAANLMQVEVAQKLGVSNTAISMWETGESLPRAEMLPKIAALYNCSIDELMGQAAVG